jgi:hypothetical protein
LRQYPQIPVYDEAPKRSISFVVVRFSDEIHHNFLLSPCTKNTENEVIIVDNRRNCFFDNLSQAINFGVKQAKYELIALVHEDVLLMEGWQQHFEKSLAALEATDSSWYVLGCLGFDKNHQIHGHCSYPYEYINDIPPHSFREIDMLDELIMIFQKSAWMDLDESTPSIHFIGRHMMAAARSLNRRAYLIDAPPIHKYADENGKRIILPEDSEKIIRRQSLMFRAEYEISVEYLEKKRRNQNPDPGNSFPRPSHVAAAPVIFLTDYNGGHHHLLSLADEIKIYTGTNHCEFGGCEELRMVMYKSIIRKYRCSADWQKALVVPELHKASLDVTSRLADFYSWGFLFLESFYLLPEILNAFPDSKFIYLRNSRENSNFNAHVTAMLENEIGRITIPLAYDYAKQSRHEILEDTTEIRLQRLRLHQQEMFQGFSQTHPLNCFELDVQHLTENHQKVISDISIFLNVPGFETC